MKVFVLIILRFAFLSVAPSAEAVNDDYQCTAVIETTAGYARVPTKWRLKPER